MSALTPDLLAAIRGRAAGYDHDNKFFWEDLIALREAGYLAPRSLLETARDQRLLAAYAPATALGINMHLVWTGVARVLHDRGDTSLDWVLADAAAGELFAFGNSEAGNDLVLWDSLTKVETVDGGYSFTGTKIFTSLAPAWTRLGIFGKQTSGDGSPRLVHGFVQRRSPSDATPGITTMNDWDTLGMRATQSHTTRLDAVVIPDDHISRFLPVGSNADPFVFAIFANFLLLIGSVYAGIADRALELGVAAAHKRTSLKNDGATYATDPDIRWRLADAALAVDALAPDLETLAADVDNLVNHGGDWFRKLTGAKHRSTETARYVVDQAMRVAGGSGYAASSELSRLQRDVLAGIYHPSDTESVHSTVATNLLGPLA
ncbi:acyl-CoA dehydrogenase family protein [soil metagenome]